MENLYKFSTRTPKEFAKNPQKSGLKALKCFKSLEIIIFKILN